MTLRLLCLCAGLGAYLCSSGLLRLNEVFFQSATADSLNKSNAQFDRPQKLDAAYDRLVIVLIDALRADMVLGSAAMRKDDDITHVFSKKELNIDMPFTSSLVTSGRALGYVAHANVPTVTMPRLKALVTGKAPAFIDILKNFNSVAIDENANLLSMLTAKGKRIVFYGDDTWLKLFPNTFLRSDGTSGFYTRDTKEVDDNVTRHLREELDPAIHNHKSQDWDVLVLHYLGLDHVGHLRGPRSLLMEKKLQEMDKIVQLVLESLQAQDALRMQKDKSARASLILLCSDHGMSEVGNHGGATVEESSALLMFMRGDGKPLHPLRDNNYRQKRNQVDLVPTISSLYGLPIPPYSTGLLLEDVVRASFEANALSNSSYWHALYRNFQQLHALATIKFHATALKKFDDEFHVPLDLLRKSLRDDSDMDLFDQHAAKEVERACEIMQAIVTQSDGSEYNVTVFLLGLAFLVVSLIAALEMLARALQKKSEPFLRNIHVVVLGVNSILQIASLSSSSSIENEHATTFFMATSLLIAIGIALIQIQKSYEALYSVGLVIVLLVFTRTLRARNQIINFWRLNGLKLDTNVPGSEFATDDSVSILSTAPILPTYILSIRVCVLVICGIVLRKAVSHTKAAYREVAILQVFVAISSILLFAVGMLACVGVKELPEKITFVQDTANDWTTLVSLDTDACARVVYAIVCFLAFLTASARQGLRHSILEMVIWLLVLLLQRDTNFQTLCLLCLQLEFVAKFLDRAHDSAFQHRSIILAGLGVWLSQAAFFALGNSHLVTTIDISQSYHGISSYSQTLVGALTFVSVFSGPLVCFVNLYQWLNAKPVTKLINSRTIQTACLVIFTYQTLRFTVYAIVVYFMRFHLFIWSVFAPKMLYEFAHFAVSLVLVVSLQ